MIRKRFLNKIRIFSKSEIDLELVNKNMHAIKCNLSNLFKKISIAI
jgi:hypothetical protein